VVARSQKLLRMATSDPLTGLFNRGYVDERLAIELSRALRHGPELTLAVIDVDRFKLLNDTHGHTAGDRVLEAIGGILRGAFRQSDTIGRYGGEEFVVILPETNIAAATQKLETLRELIASTPIALNSRAKPWWSPLARDLLDCRKTAWMQSNYLRGRMSGSFRPSAKAATACWQIPRPCLSN